MATPYACPVCKGTGNVYKGFYDGLSGTMGFDECRTCNKGIIWDYTNYEYYQYSTSKIEIKPNNPCDNCPNKNSKTGCLCTLPNNYGYITW